MYDPKLDYLVGEFSCARNKRYESYVVNRIWGLVCDLPLRPRTQMYAKVRDEEGNAHRRFIDPCFPEVGLAIECDEQQHAQQAEEDAEREREIQASDVLDGLFSGGLEFRRVVVHDRSWEDVERQIEEIAGDVRARARKRGVRAKMAGAEDRAWSFIDPVRWCAGRVELTVDDPVRFASITQACNCLFGCSYQEDTKGPRRGYFTPAAFKSARYEGWKVWFPVLYVEGMRDDKHWKNVLDPETAAIREYAPAGTRTGGASSSTNLPAPSSCASAIPSPGGPSTASPASTARPPRPRTQEWRNRSGFSASTLPRYICPLRRPPDPHGGGSSARRSRASPTARAYHPGCHLYVPSNPVP